MSSHDQRDSCATSQCLHCHTDDNSQLCGAVKVKTDQGTTATTK